MRKEDHMLDTDCRYLIKDNSIAKFAPHLLDEWDYEKNDCDPKTVTKGMNKKFWWKCKKYGHSWETTPYKRVMGSRCVYCINQKVLQGFNDLEFRYPEAAKLWHPFMNEGLLPSQVMPGSEKKYWWLGECGHHWESCPMNVTKGKKCPYCAGRKVLKGFNDFESNFPEIAKMWDYEKNEGLKPSEVTCGSRKIVQWKCSNNHEWTKQIAEQRKNNYCPFENDTIMRRRDITVTHPELVKEWDYVKNKDSSPRNHTSHSKKSVWWICKKKHSRKNMVKTRVKSGCSICNNGLAEKYPYLEEEWDYERNYAKGLIFNEVTAKSSLMAFWKCKENHVWKAVIHSRTRTKGSNCPYCSGSLILSGFNDFATIKPKLMKQWNFKKNNELKIDPTKIGTSSLQTVWWKCGKEGHEWQTILCARTGYLSSGCPFCMNRQIITGENDLATIRPELLDEWDYEKNKINGIFADPTKIAPYATIKVWWKCKEKGHSYYLSLNAKKNKCHKCWHGLASKEEKKIAEFIESIVGVDNVIRNDRKLINPKELDIYIPSLNIAFEYNGIYWHDKELYLEDLKNNSCKSSEMLKTKHCEIVKVELIHIWEDDWLENEENIKNFIHQQLTKIQDRQV